MKPVTIAFVFAALAASFASANAQTPAPPVQVTNAWSRATPGGASTGAAYLTLASPAGDTLTGASSPVAETASVHEMAMDGGVMRMRQLSAGLPLPAGLPVTLHPGGYHIMLEGLKTPLKQGQTLPLHLTFAKSAPVDVTATVAGIGGERTQMINQETTMRHMIQAIVITLCATVAASPAFAHAHLRSATPAVESTVQASPGEVAITYSEGVEPKFSTIEVQDAAGKRVDKQDVHTAPSDNKILSVGVPSLPPGTYKVIWHATAVDTHKTEGIFTFTIKP